MAPKVKLVVAGATFVGATVLGMPLASADQPDVTGRNDATEPKDTGPADSTLESIKGSVSIFSHLLKDSGSSMGDHSNNFAPGQLKTDGSATGRLGVGNAARSDGFMGDDPNSHFAGQLGMG
jgi:hypothetical protein